LSPGGSGYFEMNMAFWVLLVWL